MLRRSLLKGVLSAAGLGAGGLALAPSFGGAWAQGKPGGWLRLESANFIVFSSLNEERSRKELVALEGFRSLLGIIMPRTRQEPKLKIYLCDTTREFETMAPWADKSVFGYYSPAIEEVHACSKAGVTLERQSQVARNVRALDARTVLFHEYAHHYVLAHNRVTYPGWYNEGIAEFLSTVEFTDKGTILGKFTPMRATWLFSPYWVDIETFLGGKEKKKFSDEDTAAFYAQAWLATHYLFNTPARSQGFDRYIQALHEGGDRIGSFEPSFGITPKAFDDELKAYKRKPITFWIMKDVGVDADKIPIKIDRLSVAADDLLMLVGHLQQAPDPKDAARSIELVKARAKKHEGDPLAIRASALGDIWYGDTGVARKLLDEGLKVHTGNADLLHTSGLCDLRAAYATDDATLFKRAKGAFAAAHRIDGHRANSLYRYVECLLHETGSVDQHMLDVLVTVYNLSPQVPPFALAAGQGLMQHKRFDEASRVLKPLTANAHGGSSEVVQAVLAALAAGETPVFSFPGSAKFIEPNVP